MAEPLNVMALRAMSPVTNRTVRPIANPSTAAPTLAFQLVTRLGTATRFISTEDSPRCAGLIGASRIDL